MDALIDERVFIDSIVSPNLFDKFNDSMISKGYSYEIRKNDILIDKEIDKLIDENTKKTIRDLIKSRLKLNL